MTERKFTDEEVLAVLACCSNLSCVDYCPLKGTDHCESKMSKAAYDLIIRQRAEIERLKSMNQAKLDMIHDLRTDLEQAKTEAIKEFAERLKEKMNNLSRMDYHCDPYFLVSKDFIDKTAKEMTESKPCTEGADCSTCEYCYHDGGYNECAVEGVKL